MRQADMFMAGEGDRWLERNRDQLGHSDPVADMIERCEIKPKRVLEIGCSNGWRLAALRAMYDCEVFGVEPSMLACIEAAERKVPVWQATASALPVLNPQFDLIIYGFCLYLTDPSDWFGIVSEGNRALVDGGHIIIHDFAEPGEPFAQIYRHRAGVLSYHVAFSKFWQAHPQYIREQVTHFCDEQVTVLEKRPVQHIPVRS